MSFLFNLFSKKSNNHQNINALIEFESNILNLLDEKHYVSKKEYQTLIKDSRELFDYFNVLKQSDMIMLFCKKNHTSIKHILSILDLYQNIEQRVDDYNDNYINQMLKTEKEYLDHILNEVVPKILLDEDQRKVVLTDEDYSLVIAGAGAGKSATRSVVK